MKFAHVVAAASNGVIGRDGGLPWHLKADLQHFKKTTMGACIIMGRKTFASIGKALPGRYSIVLTHQRGYEALGSIVVHSFEEAKEACRQAPPEFRKDIAFIIGGGELYRATMKDIDEVYLTRVGQDVDGDTYYTDPARSGFRLIEETHAQDGGYDLSFQRYVAPAL